MHCTEAGLYGCMVVGVCVAQMIDCMCVIRKRGPVRPKCDRACCDLSLSVRGSVLAVCYMPHMVCHATWRASAALLVHMCDA